MDDQGVWAGMIFGGTAMQTIILTIITTRTNWEVEVINTIMCSKVAIYNYCAFNNYMQIFQWKEWLIFMRFSG